MYTPEHFRESRPGVLHAFIGRHPLGLLLAPTTAVLTADAIPMQLVAGADGQAQLRGHLARANPLWRALPAGTSVLVVFTGAVHYVSPAWYVSKQQGGRVVPTWNYAQVQARGPIRFIEDAPWLAAQIESLTDEHERSRPDRWRVSDAPADYLAGMLRGIVGFEIDIEALEGKFKASQNRSAADRAGVRRGLAASGVGTADLEELCREPEG